MANESNFSKYDAGSDYMRSADLLFDGAFRTAKLKIAKVHGPCELQTAAKMLITKPVLEFSNYSKKMVLNKTNQEVLHMLVGDARPEKAVGVTVCIEVREVPDPKAGKNAKCLGLRIMPRKGQPLGSAVRSRLGTPVVWEGEAKNAEDVPRGTEESGESNG